MLGATLLTVTLLPANYVGLELLLMLWLVAGAGQTCVNVSVQTLIAERTPTAVQGRIYDAQFAWSYLWWAFSYPLAGWLGGHWGDLPFFYGSLIGLALLVIVQLTLSPKRQGHQHESYWYEHEHIHDEYHQHNHHPGILESEPHIHPHQHSAMRHSHSLTKNFAPL